MKHPEDLPGGRNATTSINNNNSNNKISKRSNVMNATTVISRGIITLLSILFLVGVTFGGNINLKGTTGGTLNGPYNVSGNINTSGAGGVWTFSGTVSLTGTGTGTQTIAEGGGATSTKAIIFTTLNAGPGITGKEIASGGIVTVSGTFTLNTDPLKHYTVGAHTLNFGGTVTHTSGLFDAGDGGSVVNYTTGSQVVFASAYGGTLGLQGGAGATKTFSDVTSAAIVTTAASTPVTVNNDLTINGASASTIADLTVSPNKTLDVTGAGGLTVTLLSGNSGTIKANANSIAFSQATAISDIGNISATTGSLSFGGDITIGTGKSFQISLGGTATFTGNVTYSGTAFTMGAGSTAIYNNSTASGTQAITPLSSGNYVNLTLSGNTNTKTVTGFGGTVTISGTLTTTGTAILDMGSKTLSAGTITNAGTVQFGGAANGQVIATGTVEYNRGDIQTIATGGSYASLVLSGSGAKTNGAGFNVTNLTVQGAANWVNAFTVGISGDLTVDGTATISNSGTINVE